MKIFRVVLSLAACGALTAAQEPRLTDAQADAMVPGFRAACAPQIATMTTLMNRQPGLQGPAQVTWDGMRNVAWRTRAQVEQTLRRRAAVLPPVRGVSPEWRAWHDEMGRVGPALDLCRYQYALANWP